MTENRVCRQICGFSGCRPLSKLEAVTGDISAAGGGAESAKADSLNEQSVKKHIAEVAKKAGRIDVLLERNLC
jgi:NAD(P)-dependent dehydrogenase (short-subunit alcohol dehydrogenase family)